MTVNLGGVCGAYPVSLEKDHNIFDVLLFLPALAYLVDTFLSEIRHLFQSVDVIFYDIDSIQTEFVDYGFCKHRSDTFYKTATEVFLNAVDCGRHHLFP